MEQVTAIIQRRPRKKPTLKQKLFAQKYVANGGNATQAALQVYDADYQNAHAIAGDNMQKPIVIQEIDRILKSTGLSTESYIATSLKKAIDTGIGVKATNKDAITALNMLMKATNTFPGTKNTSVRLNLQGNLPIESVDKVIEQLKGSQQKTNELIEDIS